MVSHIISEWDQKCTIDFIETVTKHGLKWRTICQIVRFVSHFSLKLHIHFQHFKNIFIVGSFVVYLGSDNYEKIGC